MGSVYVILFSFSKIFDVEAVIFEPLNDASWYTPTTEKFFTLKKSSVSFNNDYSCHLALD